MIGAVQPGALAGLIDKVEEITPTLSLAMEKNRLSASVTKRDRELESLTQIGSILAASTFEREEVFKSAMDMLRTIMNVDAGYLLLLEKDELAFKVAFNINPDADLSTIQDLLGHSHVKTTQRYCRISNLKVQRDYFKAMEVIRQTAGHPNNA